jgi:hypothetical protein
MRRARIAGAPLALSLALLAIAAMAAAAQEAARSDGEPRSQPAGDGSAGGADAVVPPGQEDLLAEMLGKGATLPEGCKLTDGRVEHSTVEATYSCPAGEVVFELSHPSRAGGAATRTDRFGLTLRSGSPPQGLAPALAARIRSKEAAFEWKWIGQPRAASRSRLLLATAGLLAIAALGFVLRRRSSARRADSR